jgi:hypothetical protein
VDRRVKGKLDEDKETLPVKHVGIAEKYIAAM